MLAFNRFHVPYILREKTTGDKMRDSHLLLFFLDRLRICAPQSRVEVDGTGHGYSSGEGEGIIWIQKLGYRRRTEDLKVKTKDQIMK